MHERDGNRPFAPLMRRAHSRLSSDVLHLVQVGRALGLHVVAMDEPKRRRVDAIAQSAAVLRPVRKYMAERTSMPPSMASRHSFTLAGSIGLVKLGQPLPESNLLDEANSGSPDTTST